MGKIRTKVLGDETLEKKQKEEARQKGKEKSASRRMVKGDKGGERIVSVGPSEEELSRIIASSSPLSGIFDEVKTKQSQPEKPKTEKPKSDKRQARSRSKSYQAAAKLLGRNKKYSLSEALALLEKLKRSHFDETVELHVNTTEAGISGSATLPHGTGKTVRVAIADPSANSGQVDDLLKKIEQGIIEFDVLLATPAAMSKLAKVARVLGPKGLIPNPKNGTISQTPEKLVEQFTKGQVRFKTEAKTPIIHLSVGKISFGAKKLSENIKTIIDAVKKEKIKNITLKSTMSPGIKLNI